MAQLVDGKYVISTCDFCGANLDPLCHKYIFGDSKMKLNVCRACEIVKHLVGGSEVV